MQYMNEDILLHAQSRGQSIKELLTCKVFYIHISSLANELLDAAYLSTDCCSVQPSLSSLIPFIHFVFGFRCRVWRSLLTQTGL